MGYWDEYEDNQGGYQSPTVTQGGSPYVDERGFLGDTASSLGRGVLGLTGLVGKAAEVVSGKELGLDEWAKKQRETKDFFKQDESEYYGEQGFVKRGWQTAMESLVPSLSAAAPGAAAGAALGSIVPGIGTVGGGMVGGILSTLGIFGVGTYGEAKDEALASGMSEEDAHNYGLKKGAIEGGIEGLASGVEMYTAGIGKFFTRPLVSTLKGMMKMPAKDVAKAYGKTMLTETGTEMLQAGLGAQTDLNAGMGDTSVLSAVGESIMPALFMSGIFVTGTQAYNARQKSLLLRDLQSSNPLLQERAVTAITKNVEKLDPELAQGFSEAAIGKIKNGETLDVNMNMVDIMNEVKTQEIANEGTVDPLTTDVEKLKTQVDQKLGMDRGEPYGEAELTDDYVSHFEEMAGYQKRAKNAKGRAKEILKAKAEDVKAKAPEASRESVPAQEDEYADLTKEWNAKKIESTKGEEVLTDEGAAEFEKASLRERQEKNKPKEKESTEKQTLAKDIGVDYAQLEEEVEADRLSKRTVEEIKREEGLSTFGAVAYQQEQKFKANTLKESSAREISRAATAMTDKYDLTPEENKDLEGAYTKMLAPDYMGIDSTLTEAEQAVWDRVKGPKAEGTVVPPKTSEVTAGETIEPEATTVPVEENRAVEGNVGPTVSNRAEGIGIDQAGQPTPVSKSPEQILESRQEGTTEEVEEVKPGELSHQTTQIIVGNKDQFVAAVSKRMKDKGETRAVASKAILEEARVEAAEAGREYEVQEKHDEMHAAGTYKKSSRKDSKFKEITWNNDKSGQMQTAVHDGRTYILRLPKRGVKSLLFQDKDGNWKAVTGKGLADLKEKAQRIALGKFPMGEAVTPESMEETIAKTQSKADRKMEKVEEGKVGPGAEELADMALDYEGNLIEGETKEEELTYENLDDDGNAILPPEEAIEGPTEVTQEQLEKGFDTVNDEAQDEADEWLAENDPDFQGDAPAKGEANVSNMVKNFMEGGERKTDVPTILNEVFKKGKNTTVKPVLALINKLGKEKIEGINVLPISQSPNKDSFGRSHYDPNTNTIYYAPNASERTIAHEIIHTVTYNEIRSLGKDHPLAKKLMGLMVAYNKTLAGQEKTSTQQYALNDIQEFLAVAMTDKSVQAEMRLIPVPKSQRTKTIKTLWDAMINTIRKAFNLPKEYTSMLEEVIGLTSDLAKMDVKKQVAKTDPMTAELMELTGLTYTEARRAALPLAGDVTAMTAEDLKKTNQYFDKLEASEQTGFEKILEGLKDLGRSVDTIIEPVSRVVEKISKVAHSKLMKMETTINLKNKEHHDQMQSFGQKYNKLEKRDKEILKYYLLNSNNKKDEVVLKELLAEHGMTEDFTKVQKVLDNIYNRYEGVGLNIFKRLDRYYPRKVKDVKGLAAYLRVQKSKAQAAKGRKDKNGNPIVVKDGGLGIFDEILEDTNLSPKQQEDLIASTLNRGWNPATALKIPGSTKSRSIKRVSPEMAQFYENPVDALINTIYEANEAIETRKFVGSVGMRKAMRKVNSLQDQIADMKPSDKRTLKEKELLDALENLKDVEEISEESISNFIQNNGDKLEPEDQSQLTNALRSRLNQRGMTGKVAQLRDIGLISALGSPLNALTQAGDLVWSLYENGPINTVKAIFGEKQVTTKDLDMSHALKEFANGKTADWVSKTLKWTGFEWMDQFGKNVNMQASINKAKGTSKEAFIKKWGDSLTPETAEKVWNDIQNDNVTDDVRHFVFSSVAKFQPVSLSEMPQKYLESGNGRIFYTLKSYGIKALSNVRREIIGEFQKGNTAKASKNLMTLIPLLVLVNASVDEIKDFILGRDDAFSDTVWDNLLKLGFASRYTIDKGMQQGLVTTFLKDVLTPPGVSVADPFLKDLTNLMSGDPEEITYKSLSQIPFAGKLLYSRTTEGKGKQSDKQRKALYKRVRESVSDGNYNDVRRDINKFNTKQRKLKDGKIIDNKTIRGLKSKERSRLRKEGS